MLNANYPTKKVILSYALLGGAVGGILIAFSLILSVTGFEENILVLGKGFFVWIILGAVIGFLPALATGIIISLKHIRLITLKNYFQIASIGYLTTLPLFILLNSMATNLANDLTGFNLDSTVLTWILLLSLAGAVSSVIVGKFVLPKT